MPSLKKICPALFLLAFLLPQGADAAESPAGQSPAAERFRQLDKDSDGKVTWEELSAARPNLSRTAFDMIDSDHSGAVTLEEWEFFSSGHAGGSGMGPGMGGMDMRKMMQSMRGMGGEAKTPPPGMKMPLVMPPSASGGMPPSSPRTPSSGKMPLVLPPEK